MRQRSLMVVMIAKAMVRSSLVRRRGRTVSYHNPLNRQKATLIFRLRVCFQNLYLLKQGRGEARLLQEAGLLELTLHDAFSPRVMGVEQFVAFFAQRLAQIFLVESHDVGIFVRDANRFLAVDRVQGRHAGPHRFHCRRPMGWPPPLMQPPGQVITSMKCRSLRPARISSSSLRALPRPLTTATPSSHAVHADPRFLAALHAADGLDSRLPISSPVTRK